MKQVYIVRKDLNMRKGKIAAQCSHAAENVLTSSMTITTDENGNSFYIQKIPLSPQRVEWSKDNTKKKITVSVDSEAEMDAIRQKAADLGMEHYQVIDHGLTEFHGVHTKTVLVIGPWDDAVVDTLTGHLPLL